MEDMERYGDYNDIEYDAPKTKSIPFLIIKILTALVCVSVIGILAFRMFLFNNYPKDVENVYFNDTLTEYYNGNGGNIGAETQVIRASYDDPDVGSFFCDNLIVIRGAKQLQISLKYNVSALERISEKLLDGKEITASSLEPFTFRLVDNYGNVYGDYEAPVFRERVMYRYAKLVFDGVDFAGEESGNAPEWIRLEIFVNGVESAEPYAMICIYENHENYNTFTDYKLSGKEKP